MDGLGWKTGEPAQNVLCDIFVLLHSLPCYIPINFECSTTTSFYYPIQGRSQGGRGECRAAAPPPSSKSIFKKRRFCSHDDSELHA